MCRDDSHNLLKYHFDICYFSVKHLRFCPKWPISYFQPILAAISITIATVKVKIIRDVYTLAFVLINLQEEIGENNLT